jgi:hypothetical protein
MTDGEDGIQILRVVANIMNDQSQTATKMGPPACGL